MKAIMRFAVRASKAYFKNETSILLRLIVQQEKRNIPGEKLRNEKEKRKNSNLLIFQDQRVCHSL
jgi:hypothetical protein